MYDRPLTCTAMAHPRDSPGVRTHTVGPVLPPAVWDSGACACRPQPIPTKTPGGHLSHITLVIPQPKCHQEQLTETVQQIFKVPVESHDNSSRAGSTPLKTTAPPLGPEQPLGPASC